MRPPRHRPSVTALLAALVLAAAGTGCAPALGEHSGPASWERWARARQEAYQAYRRYLAEVALEKARASPREGQELEACFRELRVSSEGEEHPWGYTVRYRPSKRSAECCASLLGFCGALGVEVRFGDGGVPDTVVRNLSE